MSRTDPQRWTKIISKLDFIICIQKLFISLKYH